MLLVRIDISHKILDILRVTTIFSMNRQETSRTNACTECAKSKKKCVYDSSSICLRCREKNKKCLQQVPKTKKSVFELIKHYVMSKLKSTPINELNLIEENDEYYLYLKVKLPQGENFFFFIYIKSNVKLYNSGQICRSLGQVKLR